MDIRRLVILLLLLTLAPLPGLAADNPRDMVLVLDNSGSMKKNDPQFLASQAVTGFLRELDGDTRVAIIIFDQDVRVAVPMTTVDADSRATILASLKQINYRGKYTDSPAAMERAIYTLKNNGRPEASKSIIFMTDGIVDTGDAEKDREMGRWLREDLAADAASAGIRIFAIAFTEKADFHLIQSLARKTGGDYFRALAPEDLEGVFQRINEKLTPAPEPEPEPEPAPMAEPIPVVPEPAPVAAPEIPATQLQETPVPEVAPEAPIIAPVMPESVPEAMPEPVPAGEVMPAAPATVQQAPQSDNQNQLLLLLLGGAVLLLIAVVLVMLLRRRATGAAQPAAPAAAQEYVPEAYLNDIHQITDNRTHPLSGKACMLGRVAGKDTEHLDYFVIPETTVGRRHALIEYKDFSYWIIDQGSVNGTFVNDERITEPHRLKHGDRIRLHQYEFEFCLPEMADSGMTVFSSVDALQASAAEVTQIMSEPPPQEPVATPIEEQGPADEPDFDDIDLDTPGQETGFHELETDINITGLDSGAEQEPVDITGSELEEEQPGPEIETLASFDEDAQPESDSGDENESEDLLETPEMPESVEPGDGSPVAAEEMTSVFEEFGMLEEDASLADSDDAAALDGGLFDEPADDDADIPAEDNPDHATDTIILGAEETTIIKTGVSDDDDEDITLMPDQAPDKLSMDTFISTSIFNSGPVSNPLDAIDEEDEAGQTIELGGPVEQQAPEEADQAQDKDFHEETTVIKDPEKDKEMDKDKDKDKDPD